MKRVPLLLAASLVGAGCATLPPKSPPTPGASSHTPPAAEAAARPPAPSASPASRPSAPAEDRPPASTAAGTSGTLVGTTASGGAIRINPAPAVAAPGPAVADSTPSPEALAVLQTIPEPIAGQGGAPPSAAPGAPPRPSAPDTSGEAPDSSGVPVPSPTQPLGDRPGSMARLTLPDSLAPPQGAPLTASSAAARDTASSAAASPDSCWRVQVAAPPERERADRMLDAAQSQLVLPMVIERESGLFKVRTRDCLSSAAADSLRRRAVATGFQGAFRFLRKRRP